MPELKLFQFSDLHLGARFGWLPREIRERRRREQQAVLGRAVQESIVRGAQAILVPGDLFDREGADAESIALAVHAFDVPGCPPVLIAPGNHDPWSTSSPYWNPRLLGARGWAWPAHVHVFTTAEWSAYDVPNLPLRVWGRCFAPDMEWIERPLGPSLERREAPGASPGIEIAIFHGSREGHAPPGQNRMAPFSDDEIARAPFAYMGVGHYHRASRVDAQTLGLGGGVRLAYAGSAAALETTELGEHGALEVNVTWDDSGANVGIEPVALDTCRVLEVEVDVNGAAGSEPIDRRLHGALEQAGATERDIVTARLTGRPRRGVRYVSPGADVAARVYHLRVDVSGVRPDYDLDAYRHGSGDTTEDRFVRALLARLDHETDPEERARIERALYYGLDAFRLGEVVPAYEEIGT